MENVFRTSDPYAGLPGSVRMTLRKINMDSKPIQKMKAVLESTKLDFESPYWAQDPDIWAHFGFPDKKAVIVVGYSYAWLNTKGFRERWEKHGYQTLDITCATVVRLTETTLRQQVLAALELTTTLNGKKK